MALRAGRGGGRALIAASRGDRFYRLAIGGFLALTAAAVLFPIVMAASISLQTMREVYSPAPVLIPMPPQIANYRAALTVGNWPRYFQNSAIVTAVTVAVSLAINSMAGFAFARLRFRGRSALFFAILIGIMIPPQVTLIPVFTMLRSFPLMGGNDWLGRGGSGLYNTRAGLILPYVAGSFGVYFLRQYYRGFPQELDDAARIDGCGRYSQYLRIYLPLSGPALASLGILKFTGTWNEFTWPLVMTSGESVKTVQIALSAYRDEGEIYWNLLMAATLAAGIPIYIVFFAAQRHFVAGLLSGSVKG